MKVSSLLAKVFAVLICVAPYAVRAEVRFSNPALFSTGMVLQRGMRAPVWGTADPGESVTITIAFQRKTVLAGPDGRWMVRLDPMAAGGPFTLRVRGTASQIDVNDVW